MCKHTEGYRQTDNQTNAIKTIRALQGNLPYKFADDTYFIIPSIHVDIRLDELANIEKWSRKNNLTLNRRKLSLTADEQ